MSNWTHVAAIFRVDSLEDINFEDIFGKELHYTDEPDVWDEAREHPEKFLPLGSEGSLEMSVWRNPEDHYTARYTVSVFGDLRDHDRVDEIIKWFDDKCKQLWIRQAVITVENEWWNETKTKTYEHEEME